MLKVSGLFILLCELLGSSIAQSEGLPEVDFSPRRTISDLRDSIEQLIRTEVKELAFEIPFNLRDIKSIIQVKDLQVLQFSLKNYPDEKKVQIYLPFRFHIALNLPGFNPLEFQMEMDTKSELSLEKNADGSYQLIFTHCSFIPESLRIQSDSLVPATKFITANMQRKLKFVIANKLGDFLCQLFNSFLQDLNPRMTNALINELLMPGTIKATA